MTDSKRSRKSSLRSKLRRIKPGMIELIERCHLVCDLMGEEFGYRVNTLKLSRRVRRAWSGAMG
jgi:hypothetical protein